MKFQGKTIFLAALFSISTSWAGGQASLCSENFWKMAIVKDLARVQDPDLMCSKRRLIHLAASHASLDVLRGFLAKKPYLEVRDVDGYTALMLAAGEGKTDAIEILLESGADVNARTDSGSTALHHWAWAISIGKTSNEAVAMILLESGVDVDAKSNRGETALHRAIDSAIPYGRGRSAGVRVLLENGADVNARTMRGNTALHIAAIEIIVLSNTPTEIVELLLENGADPNAKNNNGDAPWEMADDADTQEFLRGKQ